ATRAAATSTAYPSSVNPRRSSCAILGSSSITSTRTASSPAPSSSELHEGSIHLIEYTQSHRQPWLLHDDRKANAWFSPPPGQGDAGRARCDESTTGEMTRAG